MKLQSFGTDLTAVVFGASGGIGSAFTEVLRGDPSVSRVLTISRDSDTDYNCDYQDENSIAEVANAIAATGSVHLVIVATGILHGDGIAPEKTWKSLDATTMADVFAINTIVPTLIAKHMLPVLEKGRKTRINRDALILGLHPGTVETGLSKPFRAGVPEAQLFSARQSVEKMLTTLDCAVSDQSGKLLAYDGKEILP